MIIRNKEKQSEKVKSQTVNAVRVKAILQNSNANPATADIDWENCQIKIILNRNGETHVIMQDDLKKLGLASTVDTLNQYAFTQNNLSQLTGNGQAAIMFKIPLGGHLNLKGDDYLYIEVSNMNGLFSQACAPTSYIEITMQKSVGYETFIPTIRSEVIQAGESNRKYDLGDNVIRAVLLNYDQQDFKTPVLSNITISSDRYTDDLTFADLVLDKTSRYGMQTSDNTKVDIADRIQQDQCFVMIDFGQEFDQVEFSIKFNPGNVNASQNYIVYWDFYTNPEIVQKAQQKMVKHQNEAQTKILNQQPKG